MSLAVPSPGKSKKPGPDTVKSFYENRARISIETQHDLQYISVEIAKQNKTEILPKLRLKRKCSYHRPYCEKARNRKLICRRNITLTIKNIIKHII